MLTTGLAILRLLAEASEPLTATAIAERVGLHTSNVSRTLRVLIEAGYVRKPSYHSFAADLGLLSLAGQAALNLPLIDRNRSPVQTLAAAVPQFQVSLATLFQEQILYLVQCRHGHDPAVGGSHGWPLHLSAVALRLISALPVAEAEALLQSSRRRYGWSRPTPAVPADPGACLATLPSLLRDGVLVLEDWSRPGVVQAAGCLQLSDQPRLAVALDGPLGDIDPVAWIHTGIGAITAAWEEE